MQSIDVKVDVSGNENVRFDEAVLAATIHLPEPTDLPSRPLVVFGVPGGGYSRGYYDMYFEGHSGYSQAEHHTAQGIIFVAVDHLGVGDSSTSSMHEMQFEDLSGCYDAITKQICAQITAGKIEGLDAVEPRSVIGIGQSMGGCVSILTQAYHSTFDGIAVLGYSAIHTRLPQPNKDQEDGDIHAFDIAKRGETGLGSQDIILSDYVYPFHFEDVPKDILDTDMEGGYPLRQTSPSFGSLTTPDCAIQMMIPQVVAKEAASLSVPVFIGNGIRDVCPDPRLEPSAYQNSPDIITTIYPNMAHMHNFGTTRKLLWDRLVVWYEIVASATDSQDNFA